MATRKLSPKPTALPLPPRAWGSALPPRRERPPIGRQFPVRRLRKRGKSLMAIRDAVRKSGVPISHETVRLVLQRPEREPVTGEAA